MTHKLTPLPYAMDSLEPYIDKMTMKIHHGKHHQGYVDKLNDAVKGNKDLENKDVDEILKNLDSVPKEIKEMVKNQGGGHSNHRFFWPLLKKNVEFDGEIAEAIQKKFGNLEGFKKAFITNALSVFGSGWGWLVLDNGELKLMKTANQDSPLSLGFKHILGVDMWEHSYYLLRGPQ